jgi:hypothetical protein
MDASKKFSHSINPIWSTILDASPSCLQFVPRDHNPGYEYFIVGTYTLLESGNQTTSDDGEDESREEDVQQHLKSQEKIGGLKLFKLDNGKV